MAQRPQHRTYGFINWNSGANTLGRLSSATRISTIKAADLLFLKFHRCSEDKGITPGTQLRNDGYLLYMLVTIILFILSKQIVICSDLYSFCLFHIDFCFDDHEFLSYPFCICSHLPSRGPRQKRDPSSLGSYHKWFVWNTYLPSLTINLAYTNGCFKAYFPMFVFSFPICG